MLLLIFVSLIQCGEQAAQADIDSRVSSVVMASTPQPKDTSCTRSISFWVVQYLAAAYRRLW